MPGNTSASAPAGTPTKKSGSARIAIARGERREARLGSVESAGGFDASRDTAHDKSLKIDLLARIVDVDADEVP
jgi:hypothetical protein